MGYLRSPNLILTPIDCGRWRTHPFKWCSDCSQNVETIMGHQRAQGHLWSSCGKVKITSNNSIQIYANNRPHCHILKSQGKPHDIRTPTSGYRIRNIINFHITKFMEFIRIIIFWIQSKWVRDQIRRIDYKDSRWRLPLLWQISVRSWN
jgi:hypothetical protein